MRTWSNRACRRRRGSGSFREFLFRCACERPRDETAVPRSFGSGSPAAAIMLPDRARILNPGGSASTRSPWLIHPWNCAGTSCQSMSFRDHIYESLAEFAPVASGNHAASEAVGRSIEAHNRFPSVGSPMSKNSGGREGLPSRQTESGLPDKIIPEGLRA